MSEDLLEHVSQRVVTEQQMNAGSRNSLRDPPRAATSLISPGVHVTSPAAHVNPSSRAATPKSVSRPPSRASNLSSLSTVSLVPGSVNVNIFRKLQGFSYTSSQIKIKLNL